MVIYLLIERWGQEPGVIAAYATKALAEEALAAVSRGTSPLNYAIEEHQVISE